jgi:hypothetical protein
VSGPRGRLIAGFGRSAFALTLVVCAASARYARAQHWWEPQPTPTPAPTPGETPEATPTANSPRCAIDVLEEPPAEAFDVVGIVEVAPRGAEANPDDSALEAARLQGCALGGEALVVVYRARRHRSGMASTPAQGGVLTDPTLRAAVIRYRER